MDLLDNLKSLAGEKKEDATPLTPQSTSPKKVLIVEDEKALADALELEFKDAGFATYKAENGQIGLEMAMVQKPDILILDLMMPVMDGKTMLHKLRDIDAFKTLPVIVLTNAGDAENIRETQTYYNADEFFVKSNVTPGAIVQKAKTLIGVF